jgi:hypothetical protein
MEDHLTSPMSMRGLKVYVQPDRPKMQLGVMVDFEKAKVTGR